MSDFSNLRIALVADEFTEKSLEGVCKLKNITPLNYKLILKLWKPDFLLVESCWRGKRNSWKNKVASYPNNKKSSNNKLASLVSYAKQLNIPTIFWNKEDGVHFDRFIDSAKLFDHVFTTDSNMLENYKQECTSAKTIEVLKFAVNTKIHYPRRLAKGVERLRKVCFLGSYYNNQHKERANFQRRAFDELSDYGLDIYDRNFSKNNKNLSFPEKYQKNILQGVSYKQTPEIYNKYIATLNVNTVTNSPTMFSRRILEAMACKCLVITNYSPAMDNFFENSVICIQENADFKKVRDILNKPYKIDEILDEAYKKVIKDFTIEKWLEQIVSNIRL